MDLNVTVTSYRDDYEDRIECQTVESEVPGVKFRVSNLCEYPEDAIIGRDLFNAYDYLDAVQLGMTLAQKGYDCINIVNIEKETRK